MLVAGCVNKWITLVKKQVVYIVLNKYLIKKKYELFRNVKNLCILGILSQDVYIKKKDILFIRGNNNWILGSLGILVEVGLTFLVICLL